MRKVIGYAYHNGMWYRQYTSGKLEACSEQEIVEHIKRVEKSKEVDNNEIKDFGDVVEKITGMPCERLPWMEIVRYEGEEVEE